MSLTYFKFLFIDTIKRKSIWITWLLYLFTVCAFLIILPIASTLSVYQLWANTTIAICQTFVGITVAIFTSVLAINIFKTSNEEGTELIIISKPISRVKIVLCKFLMFFAFCLIVNLMAVGISAFTYFMPNFEKKFYWGLVVSMFIGNLVTFGLYGFIAILLTFRFQKAGIIVTNVLIAIVLFVYQVLAVFVFSSSFKSFLRIEEGTIVVESYALPIKNDDGTYTEDHFVDFVSSPNKEQGYDMNIIDWKGLKEYWDKENAKENPWVVIATDIGSQLSASYLTVNVNGYSDRQASRMYNFSKYYDYKLTQPASPEYYDTTTGKAISPLKFIYYGNTKWGSIEDYGVYGPSRYLYPGVRNTKASFLKGTMTDKIPVANLQGKGALDYYDVLFEPEDWQKYGPIFDIMYDNIYKYDLKNGNGDYYYDLTDPLSDKKTFTKALKLNTIWCSTTVNLQRYYRLVWACLSGHHSDKEYFGDNDPLKNYTRADLDINSVYDLNYRYLQFKDYLFYKVYKDQQELMFSGNNDWSDYEKIIYQGLSFGPYKYTGAKETMETYLKDYGMTLSGVGIGENGYVVRGIANGKSEYIQPGTQTINLTLINNVADLVRNVFDNGLYIGSTKVLDPIDPESDTYINEAINGSYAKWMKFSSIAQNALNPYEYYLFDSLDTPERNNNWVSDQYTMYKAWMPYSVNLYYKDTTGFPFGQNTELSMYTCENRVQFWVFAAIWGGISLAGYAGGFITYNKYDIK